MGHKLVTEDAYTTNAQTLFSSTKRSNPASTIIPASSLQTRHPGKADAAHRHARVGLREQYWPKPTRVHAQHAPQPRSIAWEGGGEAAMKGGAPCFLRESFWTRSSNGSSDVVNFLSKAHRRIHVPKMGDLA